MYVPCNLAVQVWGNIYNGAKVELYFSKDFSQGPLWAEVFITKNYFGFKIKDHAGTNVCLYDKSSDEWIEKQKI